MLCEFGIETWYWTSITINKNYASRVHVDKNNVGPSIIKAFGDFSGGELLVWPGGKTVMAYDVSGGLTIFDGNVHHAANDFTGERFSLIFFVSKDVWKSSIDVYEQLYDLGFNPPPLDISKEDPWYHHDTGPTH